MCVAEQKHITTTKYVLYLILYNVPSYGEINVCRAFDINIRVRSVGVLFCNYIIYA